MSYGQGMEARTTAGGVDPASVNAHVRESYPGSLIECTIVTPTAAAARSVPTADDIRPGGYISGPTQFAIADAALWYLVFGALGRVELMALTSELSIRYLRPAVGDVLYGRAELASISRRSVVGTVWVWAGDNEHRPSAVAQGTYALPLT
jgi:acyl-coenzyme A thioesterase PaaI-like protein